MHVLLGSSSFASGLHRPLQCSFLRCCFQAWIDGVFPLIKRKVGYLAPLDVSVFPALRPNSVALATRLLSLSACGRNLRQTLRWWRLRTVRCGCCCSCCGRFSCCCCCCRLSAARLCVENLLDIVHAAVGHIPHRHRCGCK